MDKYLNSEKFNQEFWLRAKKKEEVNKAFVSAIARNYDISPFTIEKKTYTINELNISYTDTFKDNWHHLEDLFDKPIKHYEEMLNNEEEMIKAKTEALKLHIASLENDIKKLNQESDKVLAEHALILGNFYDINYLYELYCKPESDDKKRKYYLGQYAKYYKEEINKIKELQESPLGIARIESQYQTKKHELFDKYHHLLKDDVNMLQDSNRYFETVGFVKYGNDRINDQKLNEEFKDFFNNTFMPKEKEFKQKIQELNDTLKNISYKNIEHSQENLDKITRELSALEKENNTLLSFTEEQYLDYLKENGRSLTKELINSKKIAANESKIKGYNENIKKLSKEIALNEKIIKHYNERENRFIEYRKNELSNLNTYNQLKDMLPEERDKALLEKFMNLKAEVKVLNQYNDVMKPKGYSALLSKKSEFQSKIDLLKVENKSIEAKNKQINALIKENNAKIEGIKTYLKENASYKKSQNQIDDDRKILTSLEALRKYTTILLDSNTNKLLKTNTFLKMASDYLDVTEGVYVLKQDKNPLLKLPNKEYYPIKMAFDSYMHYTKAQTLKIDPTNFNLELLDLKAIHLMYQSLSSSINVINKEINRLDKIVYNPFSVIKDQSLKKQAKLRQKYNLAQKTYESDKKLFDETTTAIANYTEKLEALNSKLKDYRNKIATSGENLSYSKEMFEKNISENEYLFQAKIKIRKQINESIDNTKKAYNEELKALEDEYSLKRSEAINKNNEAIAKLQNSTILNLSSDDEKINYAKNIELKLKGQKSTKEIALKRQDLLQKANEFGVNKDKIINANGKKIEEIKEKIQNASKEINNLKGPLSNYTKINNNLNNALKNKSDSLKTLDNNIKASYRNNDSISKLGKLVLDYEFKNPTYTDKEYEFDLDAKAKYPTYIKILNERLSSSLEALDLRYLEENSTKDDLICALNLLDEIQTQKEMFYEDELQSVNVKSIASKASHYMKDKKEGLANYFFSKNNSSLVNEIKANHLILRGSNEYSELEKSLQALNDERSNLSEDERLDFVKEKAMAYLSYKHVSDTDKLNSNTKGRVMFALNIVARIDAYKALEEKGNQDLNKSVSYRQAIVIDELNFTNSLHRSNSVDAKVINKEIKK